MSDELQKLGESIEAMKRSGQRTRDVLARYASTQGITVEEAEHRVELMQERMFSGSTDRKERNEPQAPTTGRLATAVVLLMAGQGLVWWWVGGAPRAVLAIGIVMLVCGLVLRDTDWKSR